MTTHMSKAILYTYREPIRIMRTVIIIKTERYPVFQARVLGLDSRMLYALRDHIFRRRKVNAYGTLI